MLSYSSYKFARLSAGTDYVVQQRNLENKFATNDTFGLADQFTIAASLWSEESGDTEDITDPEIGEIKFYYKTYSLNSSLEFK